MNIEYLNGIRNGKGKEYYDNGKLKCKDKYLNGMLMGKERIFWWWQIKI